LKQPGGLKFCLILSVKSHTAARFKFGPSAEGADEVLSIMMKATRLIGSMDSAA